MCQPSSAQKRCWPCSSSSQFFSLERQDGLQRRQQGQRSDSKGKGKSRESLAKKSNTMNSSLTGTLWRKSHENPHRSSYSWKRQFRSERLSLLSMFSMPSRILRLIIFISALALNDVVISGMLLEYLWFLIRKEWITFKLKVFSTL